MKIISWIKSLSWIVIAGAIGTAALMILNAYKAGKMEVQVKHDEDRVKRLNKGTAFDIAKAEKLQDDIDVKKDKARVVRKKSEAALERIGQHETMADIAERFNNKRVRSRSDAAAELRDG